MAPLPLTVTASVGIVAVGDRSSPGRAALGDRRGRRALRSPRAAGKNCAEIFRARSSATIRERYELEFDLRRALEEEEFTLQAHSADLHRLDDLTPGLVGVEALLRWEHPIMGTIQPNEFIPVLEANGQIIKVGRWVLSKACLQMAEWHARGSEITLAVNVSGRQLESDGVVDDIRDALELSGLDAASLTIEVTETVLMRNTDSACARLGELKKLGVEIAIDDFGTGFSSLAYLQKFPVDCLKIDRMFTSSIGHSREAARASSRPDPYRPARPEPRAHGPRRGRRDEGADRSPSRRAGRPGAGLRLVARLLDPETPRRRRSSI